MGITTLEYAGLSTANGTAVLDSSASANGTTSSSAATISSGATAAAGHTNELALGLYADSGYSDTLTAGTGWTQRSNISPVSSVEVLQRGPAAQQRRHSHGHGRHRRQDALGADRPPPQARLGDTADGAERAEQRRGHRRQRLGDGELDRTGQRREPHHLLHRHALRRDRPRGHR